LRFHVYVDSNSDDVCFLLCLCWTELPDGTELDIDTPEGLVAGDVFEIELDY
jgi:hypothetical protein